jgi:calcineurin-like phosphoesterase family protein
MADYTEEIEDLLKVIPMERVWFSSDTHYGHANVIKYAKRPFSNVEEMNEAMITQWNSVVKPDDLVYHLGDFALCRPAEATTIAKRLNGRKHLVFGNHDRKLRENKPFRDQWIWTKDYAEIEVEGQKIILMHYSMRIWNKAHYGSYQLYGHSHGSLKDDTNIRSMDVGVDCWNYAPISFETVKEHMNKKTWKPIDHHGRQDEEGNE